MSRNNISTTKLFMKFFTYAILIIVLLPLLTHAQFDDVNINKTIIEWKKAWDKKDINGISNLLTYDYEYCSINSKWQNKSKRLSSIKSFFSKYKKIGLILEIIKLGDSTSSQNDVKVIFKQHIVTEKTNDYSIVTMRFFKGEESNSIWKIYREIEDKPESINETSEYNKSNSESSTRISKFYWYIIIIILIVILINRIKAFMNSKCPKCGKAYAKKYINRNLIDSKECFETVQKEVIHYNNQNQETGKSIVPSEVHVTYNTYRYYYRCKYCSHDWSELVTNKYRG